MYVITKENDVIMHISKTKDFQDNGNLLVDNGTLAIPRQLYDECYRVQNVPDYIEPEKYCYTPQNGFYKNENYVKYYTLEERVALIEDLLDSQLLGGE